MSRAPDPARRTHPRRRPSLPLTFAEKWAQTASFGSPRLQFAPTFPGDLADLQSNTYGARTPKKGMADEAHRAPMARDDAGDGMQSSGLSLKVENGSSLLGRFALHSMYDPYA